MKELPLDNIYDSYRGSNPEKMRKSREFNRSASAIIAHINSTNSDLQDEARTINSSSIVHALGIDRDVVDRVMMKLDGGHNGITVFKGRWDKHLPKS